MNILVAEDDKFLSSAYKVKLEKEGFGVKLVHDGEEAFNSLAKTVPDVILLDLVMPNMDGFDFLKKVREIDKYKKIPVVVASNLGQKEDIDKAMALGADDFIVKSDLSIDEVIKKITSTKKHIN